MKKTRFKIPRSNGCSYVPETQMIECAECGTSFDCGGILPTELIKALMKMNDILQFLENPCP